MQKKDNRQRAKGNRVNEKTVSIASGKTLERVTAERQKGGNSLLRSIGEELL